MMTENNFAGLSPRHQFVDENIQRIDGRSPDPLLTNTQKWPSRLLPFSGEVLSFSMQT